jgi:hypothetical protein
VTDPRSRAHHYPFTEERAVRRAEIGSTPNIANPHHYPTPEVEGIPHGATGSSHVTEEGVTTLEMTDPGQYQAPGLRISAGYAATDGRVPEHITVEFTEVPHEETIQAVLTTLGSIAAVRP